MGKWTKGPWKAYHVDGAGWSVRKQHERPGYRGLAPVCSMAWWQFDMPGIMDNEISEANARLIASSPALATALQAMLSIYERDPEQLTNDEESKTIEQARAALRDAGVEG